MSSPVGSSLMKEEKKVPEIVNVSVTEQNRLGPESSKRGAEDVDEAKSSSSNLQKNKAALQREQKFKTLQVKHKHKSEMDALGKVLRQKEEEIENLKKQLTTQEEQNAAYKKEIEKQRKLLKDNELDFENRLNQLKMNLENIHLQELKEKVTRVRKEEQSTARLQLEELKEQMESAKRIQKNQTRRNEEDYQVTLLQLQVEELQTQIRELNRTKSGEKKAKETLVQMNNTLLEEKKAKETLLEMNKNLREEVNTSTKKMQGVEATIKQVVGSKMQFVEKSTAEIARLHQELSLARMELARVNSELLSSQRQVATQAAYAVKLSTSPRADRLNPEMNSRARRKSAITDSVRSEKKSSKLRTVTSPRSEQEKKSTRSGMKSPRSEQHGKKSPREQAYEKKLLRKKSAEKQRAGRISPLSPGRKSPLSPNRLESQFEKQRARRKSTGSEYVPLQKQLKLKNRNSERLNGDKRSKTAKKPPRTEHISVNKHERSGMKDGARSKSPNTEHIQKRQLRRRSSVPKAKPLELNPYKQSKMTNVELKHNKHHSPNGYEPWATEEPRPFGISRDGRSISTENQSKPSRKPKSNSQVPRFKEREKYRRGSRTLRDSLEQT